MGISGNGCSDCLLGYNCRVADDPPAMMKVSWRARKALRLTKPALLVIAEVGMLSGIVLAGYTLPGDTSLKTFGMASAAIFLLGNVLIVRALWFKSFEPGSGRRAWPHIIRAFAILALFWLVEVVMFRKW